MWVGCISVRQVDVLMDQEVQHLSGGELQRVAITMCLGLPADIYLIDEPSAYLDSEQRIIAAKVWRHALSITFLASLWFTSGEANSLP